MQNFDYQTPTRLVFGQGAISKLHDAIAPYGKRVLLTYGGGSIKKIGIYDKVKELLADMDIFELSGIEPNPKYTSVLEGVKICKEQNIDVLLAVGGGSVLDCTKAIAGAANYDGEPWDIITGKVATPANALPIVDILTLAATGSEYDNASVISRTETNDKLAYFSPYTYPAVSILDPTYTFSVSKKQTAAGTADAINHIMEQYFVADTTLLNDGFCEAAIRSLMVNVKKALANPEDYTARAELMLACSYGCNGIYALGNSWGGWPCHGMEHALSAYYDITHGEGLAILTPRWMRHIMNDQTIGRMVKFAENVMDVPAEFGTQEQIAEEGISRLYAFFEEIGIPMTLREVGIDESRIDEMAQHVADNEGLENAWAPLLKDDIAKIFTASL